MRIVAKRELEWLYKYQTEWTLRKKLYLRQRKTFCNDNQSVKAMTEF